MRKEVKYYGIHACLAIAAKRPQDIIRVYIDEKNVKLFSSLLKGCAQNKKAYHIVPTEDLNRVSDSVHHEGICLLALERPYATIEEVLNHRSEKLSLLYLDGVENPHNLGSILRTAAHFGVPYLLGESLPLTPSACRIAKGGAESVGLVLVKKPMETLAILQKKGFALIATSAHKGGSLYRSKLPPRAIFAIGSESTGLQKTLLQKASQIVHIPGTGAVESLNVAVATGLCMGEYARQHAL